MDALTFLLMVAVAVMLVLLIAEIVRNVFMLGGDEE